MGGRGRARMGELEKILAGHLVRRRAFLPLARDQSLQNARARALVALSRLHALFGLRRRAPEARGTALAGGDQGGRGSRARSRAALHADRKSTRLNSSHGYISYAVFCLKKKTTIATVICTLIEPSARNLLSDCSTRL